MKPPQKQAKTYIIAELLAQCLGLDPRLFVSWCDRLSIPAGFTTDGKLAWDADTLLSTFTTLLTYTYSGITISGIPLRRFREFLYGPTRPHRSQAAFLTALTETVARIRAESPPVIITTPVVSTHVALPTLLRAAWAAPRLVEWEENKA